MTLRTSSAGSTSFVPLDITSTSALQQGNMTSSVESRLDYSHRDVTTIPDDVINTHQSVAVLDVSNNQISNVSFVANFKELNSLILDHNLVTSDAVFPAIPTVSTLWINFNRIDRLAPFIGNLRNSFPNLKHLSLMGNEASPPCTEDTFYDYVKYRLMVISCLTSLEYLDDRRVADDEREEADRLYGEAADRESNEPSNLSDYVLSMVDKFFSFITPSSAVNGSSHGASVI